VAEFVIETHERPGVTQLALSGEFDLAGVERFAATMATVEAAGPAVVVVDLGELTFMDSSGLRALVAADERARKAGRRLAIVPGPPQVRRVFEITQLDGRLDLVDDASAVAGPESS
jgi:anti-anti-sigma factor